MTYIFGALAPAILQNALGCAFCEQRHPNHGRGPGGWWLPSQCGWRESLPGGPPGSFAGYDLGHVLGRVLGHVLGHALGHVLGLVLGHVLGNALGHALGHDLS